MSAFTPIKKQEQSKIPYSQPIKTADEPDKTDTKPDEPVNPAQPEAK
jgi:hypothetical protein